MDEYEFSLVSDNSFNDCEVIITKGSRGSEILLKRENKVEEISVDAVKCENVLDATGCGDTYMASYLSCRLKGKSIRESADFASLISARKLKCYGPFRK